MRLCGYAVIAYNVITRDRALTYSIIFTDAGDGCFYIGLGGNKAVPKPTYEPYQCCPAKVERSTKVPKATPSNPDKASKGGSRKPETQGFANSKFNQKSNKAVAVKPEKGSKGKKGLFGSGNIWWW